VILNFGVKGTNIEKEGNDWFLKGH